MSHIPASYDHFWWFSRFVKLDNFCPSSRKSHFRRFANTWPRGKKTKKIEEIIFLVNVFSRIVHLVPEVGEFWVLGCILGFLKHNQHFEISELDIFRFLTKSWFSTQNRDFELIDRFQIYISDLIIFSNFFYS